MGYDISISEDRFNVINAIEMAFTFNNHLPSEILHDNFSANKTDEIKTIKSKLEHLGVTFRASKVGNAKDKTHVERAFGRIQTLVMKLFHDYIGEGITTRKKEGKPDDSFWKEATKKGDLTMGEMKHRLSHIVKMYNNLTIGERPSPVSLYEVSPKPHAIVLSPEQIPFIFWRRKTVTIRKSMLVMTVKKQEYFYELPTHELKLHLNGEKVDVFYDENDLDIIHLFTYERDNLICECRRFEKTRASQVGRDEAGDLAILKHDAKNKSFQKHIKKAFNEMVSKGLKQVKKEELTRIDPITTSKYNVNDLESEAIRQRYLEREGIDDSEMDLLKGQPPMKTYYSNDYEEIDFETIKVKRDHSEIKAYKRKSPDD